MSVVARDISFKYGSEWAVRDLSFQAEKGEIIGLLGPNGAGKTTVMRILTGSLHSFRGEAYICGLSVKENPVGVKTITGYLPENNPLYREMYVKEYLAFIGSLHRLSQLRNRIEEVIRITGLAGEQHKMIKALSKGYRQRVGIAHAIMHKPEVLILDEPTSGLDPNQLIEVRNIIRELGKEKTVIFSSHILQEVQAICDRVIIMQKGEVVTDKSIRELDMGLSGNQVIYVEFNRPVTDDKIELKDLQSAIAKGPQSFLLTFSNASDHRENIFDFAVKHKLKIREMQQRNFTMEEIFQSLTKSN